jgi:arsenite-transporting ATPase
MGLRNSAAAGLRKLLQAGAPKYEFFGGKGGTGKTTIAASTALYNARNGKNVLIISTDPAHSLSDSFEQDIGGSRKKIEKNLYAVEIDPAKAIDEYKQKINAEIKALESLGLSEHFDLAGATPGIDELAAFDRFVNLLGSKDYELIVFDTAPTGHTLRFLSLPELMNSWIGHAIKMRARLEKLADLVKSILPFSEPEKKERATEVLERMKERIREAREVLADKNRTAFNLVLLPEELSLYEGLRATKSLEGYGLHVKRIIVNQIVPTNPTCKFCSVKRRQQLAKLERIRRTFKEKEILTLPMFREEIKGKSRLMSLANILWKGGLQAR